MKRALVDYSDSMNWDQEEVKSPFTINSGSRIEDGDLDDDSDGEKESDNTADFPEHQNIISTF